MMMLQPGNRFIRKVFIVVASVVVQALIFCGKVDCAQADEALLLEHKGKGTYKTFHVVLLCMVQKALPGKIGLRGDVFGALF